LEFTSPSHFYDRDNPGGGADKYSSGWFLLFGARLPASAIATAGGTVVKVVLGPRFFCQKLNGEPAGGQNAHGEHRDDVFYVFHRQVDF
jgi:hypothetical protein